MSRTNLPKGAASCCTQGFGPVQKRSSGKGPECVQAGWVPCARVVVDLVGARLIDLAIVEGIQSMTGGGGPWDPGTKPAAPGLIVAGTNCVTTDAVCMALMGFGSDGRARPPPFENCDSTPAPGEDAGIGTRDLKRIEVMDSYPGCCI